MAPPGAAAAAVAEAGGRPHRHVQAPRRGLVSLRRNAFDRRRGRAEDPGTQDYDTNKSRSVDAFVTLNVQARYTGFEGLTLALGIENALDETPPFAVGDGDADLYGYVSSQHDPRGRFAYGRVTYRF